MTLKVHAHPLSSYCWKVFVALDEAGLTYELVHIDLADPEVGARFRRISPFGMMPVLEDLAKGVTTPEATVIIQHLARSYPSAAHLVPTGDDALDVAFWDRVFDLHVQNHLQRVVGDRLRTPETRDPFGVAQAKAALSRAYEVVEERMAGREWVAGGFTMADCAACPALHYANKVVPIAEAFPNTVAYLARLEARPSFARVLEGAKPYAHFFPQEPA
jgi:glutathione S-transferase